MLLHGNRPIVTAWLEAGCPRRTCAGARNGQGAELQREILPPDGLVVAGQSEAKTSEQASSRPQSAKMDLAREIPT